MLHWATYLKKFVTHYCMLLIINLDMTICHWKDFSISQFIIKFSLEPLGLAGPCLLVIRSFKEAEAEIKQGTSQVEKLFPR